MILQILQIVVEWFVCPSDPFFSPKSERLKGRDQTKNCPPLWLGMGSVSATRKKHFCESHKKARTHCWLLKYNLETWWKEALDETTLGGQDSKSHWWWNTISKNHAGEKISKHMRQDSVWHTLEIGIVRQIEGFIDWQRELCTGTRDVMTRKGDIL